MTEWADRAAVEGAIREWSAGQVACRAYGHSWGHYGVRHRPGEFTILQRCPRCTNTREQTIDEQGYPTSHWHIHYEDGYLLERHTGRVGQDGKAALRLASLSGMQVVEDAEVDS